MIRPSRSASRLVSSGAAETRQVSRAGRDRQPGVGVAERHAGGRLRQRVDRLLDGALDREHPQHPPAPTSARVIFSTASAEVRSGITRKPA